MTNWEKDFDEAFKKTRIVPVGRNAFGSMKTASKRGYEFNLKSVKEFIKSQRLEVLRECLEDLRPIEGKNPSAWFQFDNDARFLLGKWLSRGDLSQEEYDSLIKEFNL